MTKIHVWKTFKLTLRDVWKHKLKWARVLCAPWILLLIGILAELLGVALIGDSLTRIDGNPVAYDGIIFVTLIASTLCFMIAGSFSFVASIQLILNTFHYALLGKGGKQWWSLHFNRQFLKMTLYCFLYILIIGFVIGIVSALYTGVKDIYSGPGKGTPLYLLGIAMAVGGIWIAVKIPYLAVRLSLFPLFIAGDKPGPFRSSWDLLDQNVARFLGLLILLSIPMITYIVPMILSCMHTGKNPFLSEDLSALITLILVPPLAALTAKGSAFVYKTLAEEKEASSKKTRKVEKQAPASFTKWKGLFDRLSSQHILKREKNDKNTSLENSKTHRKKRMAK